MSLGSSHNMWRGMLITHTVLGQLQGIPKVATEFSQHLIKTCTEVGSPLTPLGACIHAERQNSISTWHMPGQKTSSCSVCSQHPGWQTDSKMISFPLLQTMSHGSEDNAHVLL